VRDRYLSASARTKLPPIRQRTKLLAPAPLARAAALAPGGTGGRKTRLLFLCTGNSARSQMAEALVEQRSAGTVEARSAGSHPKPLHPEAVRVMAARGVDIAGRPTKPLTRFTRHRFDRVITLCDKVREVCPEFPGAPATAHWSIPDPATAGPDAFAEVADDIEGRVGLLLADLRAA
jgi:protein-tyrosine-phosphatase